MFQNGHKSKKLESFQYANLENVIRENLDSKIHASDMFQEKFK